MQNKFLKNFLYLSGLLAITSCSSTERFTDQDVEQKYNNLDRYDNISMNKMPTENEIKMVKEKWYSGHIRERMETYKGHTFKIETKTHIGELKEFRVRWVSDNGKSYSETIESMISNVAGRYMTRTCGTGMPVTVYSEASLGLKKQDLTKWEVQYGGSEIKEYGFRCLFNK